MGGMDDEPLEELARKALEGVTCPVHGTPISVRVGVDEAGDETMEFDACCEAAIKLIEEIIGGDDA
jgi:hypothetical protein